MAACGVQFQSKIFTETSNITDCLSPLVDEYAVRKADSRDMEVEEYVKFMATGRNS